MTKHPPEIEPDDANDPDPGIPDDVYVVEDDNDE